MLDLVQICCLKPNGSLVGLTGSMWCGGTLCLNFAWHCWSKWSCQPLQLITKTIFMQSDIREGDRMLHQLFPQIPLPRLDRGEATGSVRSESLIAKVYDACVLMAWQRPRRVQKRPGSRSQLSCPWPQMVLLAWPRWPSSTTSLNASSAQLKEVPPCPEPKRVQNRMKTQLIKLIRLKRTSTSSTPAWAVWGVCFSLPPWVGWGWTSQQLTEWCWWILCGCPGCLGPPGGSLGPDLCGSPEAWNPATDAQAGLILGQLAVASKLGARDCTGHRFNSWYY